MTLTLTGHRPERLVGKEAVIKDWIKQKVQELNPDKIISGMAKGADQMLCDIAMELNIPLICAFPYRHALSESEQTYAAYAEEVRYETDNWYKACYLKRDEWMVDHADIVLAVWDGKPKGGTYYTKSYAEKKGVRVELCPCFGE